MSKLKLYRVYDYADPEGIRVRNYGYYWAPNAKDAVVICVNGDFALKECGFLAGRELYAELIVTRGYDEALSKEPEGFRVDIKDRISNRFRFVELKTQFEEIKERIARSGLTDDEIKIYVEMGKS